MSERIVLTEIEGDALQFALAKRNEAVVAASAAAEARFAEVLKAHGVESVTPGAKVFLRAVEGQRVIDIETPEPESAPAQETVGAKWAE